MKDDTKLVDAGRDPGKHAGTVNPPVYHASTIIYPTVAEMEAARLDDRGPLYYGRMGTPTIFALEDALTEIEGGHATVLMPSGLAACAMALLSHLDAGDHVLMTDSVYGPTRKICHRELKRLGIETSYYDPLIGAGIDTLFQPNTKVVFLESPGSMTFEVQDVPAIAKAAHGLGATVIMDNTWATPLFFKPLDHGVDLSVQALTKYIGGHADLIMGSITANETAWKKLKTSHRTLGMTVAPDDAYLALRGLRSLSPRLARHQETGFRLAEWLAARPEVHGLLHPGLADHPGHTIWRRDFTGANGLFGVILKPVPKAAVDAMLDSLKLFALGYSWGGYESLIIPANPGRIRTATTWQSAGPLLRLHAGLEDVDDLMADLEQGFDALHRAL